jgi:hypothetical protein
MFDLCFQENISMSNDICTMMAMFGTTFFSSFLIGQKQEREREREKGRETKK